MAQGQVTKIYELKTLGYDDIIKQLQGVESQFRAIKKAKQDLEKQKAVTTEPEELKRLSQALADAKAKAAELKLEKINLTNEAKAAQNIRQAEINQQKEAAAGAKTAAGSYAALYAEYKQLYALVKQAPTGTAINFQGQTLGYDQAIAKLQQLAAAEQNFRRQFTADKLLVGEYTTGIVQAFKSMGLGDLIGGQVTKANNRLKDLNSEFEHLKQQLNTVRAAGQEGLEKIEAELISNRKEAQALQHQVGTISAEMKGVGSVGDRITDSIGKNFKEMRGHAASFLLTFVGIQGAFEFIKGGIEKFEGVERATTRLEAVIKNLDRESDFENINKNLDQLRAKFQFLSNKDLKEATEKFLIYGKLSADQINKLTEVSVNLASESGESVSDASENIIKALEGNAKALKRYGINIKDAGDEQERFALIADVLGKKVSGQAQAFSDSESGKIQGYERRLASIQTKIGSSLLPVLAALSSILIVIAGHLPAFIALLVVYAAGWALANKEMVIARAEMIFQRVTLPILTVLMGSQEKAVKALAVATEFLTRAKRALLAVMQNPYFRVFAGILTLAAFAAKAYANSITEVVTKTRAQILAQQFANEINSEANKQISETVAKEKTLLSIIKDRTLADATRQKALADLRSTMGEYAKDLSLENVLTEKGTKLINDYNEALLKKAKTTAAAAIVEKENAKLSTLIQQQTEVAIAKASGGSISTEGFDEDFLNKVYKRLGRSEISTVGATIGKKIGVNFTYSGDDLNAFAAAIQEEINAQLERTKAAEVAAQGLTEKKSGAVETVFDKFKALVKSGGTDKEFSELLNLVKTQREGTNRLTKEYGELKKLEEQINDLLNPKKGNEVKANKDKLSLIDAAMKTDLANAETDMLNIKKVRELTYNEEVAYVRKVEAINSKYINQKIAYLASKKNLEAEEKEKLAGFKKDLADIENKSVEEINKANEKQYKKDEENLKAHLEEQIALIEDADKRVQEDPNSSATARAQSKLDADKKILALQGEFNLNMEFLELMYSQQSVKSEKDRAAAILKIRQALKKDEDDLEQASLKDIKASAEKQIAEFKAIIAAKLLAISESSASERNKANARKALENEENIGVLAREVASMERQLPIYKKLLQEKKITDLEYQKFLEELRRKEAQLNDALTKGTENGVSKIVSLKDRIKDAFQSIFNIKSGSDSDQLLGQALSETYSLAEQAMNAYFDAEQQRIRDSLALTEERLDIEKRQALAKAQSRAEEESIERQFAAKKKEEERKAHEDLKRAKKSEAKIALATELANLWSSVWQLGPIAGPIFGAIFTGLALARYSLRVGEINREKFEYGGIPSSGGKFGGSSHAHGGTPFMFKGRSYEAEADELAVIRTKDAPRNKIFSIAGTQAQIASKLNAIGGGVDFHPGGDVQKFESGGYLGSSLQPPVYRPAISGGSSIAANGITKDDLLEITGRMEDIANEQSKRIDRMEVVQVTSTVHGAIKKAVKQDSIGNF
jgi:hypothetical protein